MPGSGPASGLPAGVQVGATGPRLLAALVEVGPIWLLVSLALVCGVVVNGRPVVAILFLLLASAWAVLVWAQRATKAAGPGMRLDSLQIVGYSDGRPIGWGRVLVRWAVFAGLTVSVVGLIAMAVAMARHPRRQGWHDLAGNSVVIRERRPAPRHTQPAVAQPAVAQPAVARASAPATVAAELVESGAPATQTATAPVVAAVSGIEWWLRLDDGRDIGVDGLVLLGRNPQPRIGEEGATLIKVIDKTRRVSKSHVAVGVAARGLYVMDRGSTNGTAVTAPDGGQRPCPPGDLIDVAAGSVISFGDRWLEVRRPGRVQSDLGRQPSR